MNASAIERRTMVKVWWRIVPLMIAVLFFSFLDRVNISFAALTMNRDLGLSNAQFGAGVGAFAIGYALFGIPSVLLLHRFGARRWIALIMALWGLCSAATAFVGNADQLFAMRFLLGVAEAGFSPGIILYFSYWFPEEYRGRVFGTFFFIQPLAIVFGGPMSSALIEAHGAFGLAGWQLLFIAEALPTIVLAPAVLLFLPERPERSTWLADDERAWLAGRLAANSAAKATMTQAGAGPVLLDPRLWGLTLVNLGIGTCGMGILLFMPLVIQSMGYSVWATGLLTTLPAVLAAIGIPVWGWWTDRARNRGHIVTASCAMIALGLLAAAALHPSPWAIVALSVSMVGLYGGITAFWTLPTTFLSGAAAAAGLAIVNIAGNFGAFTGPMILGRVSDSSGSFAPGMLVLGWIGIGVTAAMFLLAKMIGRRQ